MSSYTQWQLYWTIFPSWTWGLKVWLEIKQLLSIRSLCYQNQSNILEEIFLFWQKTQLCLSLLLVTKFIYLVKVSLILILTTYTFFFQNSFFTDFLSLSKSRQICALFLHTETNNHRKKLLSPFFLNKNISILYTFSLLTTYILLALHIKMFHLSFLHMRTHWESSTAVTIFNPWKF